MAVVGTHYVGDRGTIIDIDMGEDVSAGTALQFHVRQPDKDKTIVIWVPSAHPTDVKKLRYTTDAGTSEFVFAGVHTVQPELTLGTWHGRGKPATFDVQALFE